MPSPSGPFSLVALDALVKELLIVRAGGLPAVSVTFTEPPTEGVLLFLAMGAGCQAVQSIAAPDEVRFRWE